MAPCRPLESHSYKTKKCIYVWTEPLRLNLSGPGNGRVTYLSRFPEPIPKNSL